MVLLLFLANGIPILARKLFGTRLAAPLNSHRRLSNGHHIFGPSKTWRGVLLSIIGTSLGAWLLGLGVYIGALIGLFAMLGDLMGSFIKRRLGMPPSSMALGLDQVPESLLPMLICMPLLDIDWTSVLIVVSCFFIGELLISRLLYSLNIRDRPY